MLVYFKGNAGTLRLKPQTSKRNAGFTLIELVIVIIILGILSATVAPKFFSSNGFSEYAYRADVIAKLRLIQTRAMQQVNDDCHKIKITASQLGKATCDTPSEFVDQKEQRATLVEIDNKDNVTFAPATLEFSFDHMGRPENCNNPCKITITGEQALEIMIESEGYIHGL
jgi:MSHA pilin protein MshC